MVKSNIWSATAAASLLLLPGAFSEGLYPRSSEVLQLDSRNYDSLIAKSNHTSIVEFYAPWCGHCKNLQPAYEKAAKTLKGLAKVAAVNCDEESNKQFCGSMGVQGFPTLKIVRPGKKPGRPAVEDYQGPRTAKGIVDAVSEKIPNHVKRLKDADYASWAASSAGPKAILFSDKGTVSSMLKAIAIDFLGSIELAQIRDKEKDAVAAFSVTKYPTLVLLPGEGKDPITYNGEIKKAAIIEFLSQAAAPNPDPAPKKASSKSQKKPADKKASKSSSKFAASSASQKSSQSSASKATQTAETLVEDNLPPNGSPDPKVPSEPPVPLPVATTAPLLSAITFGPEFEQSCLSTLSGTCILALLPEADAISESSDSTSDSTLAVRALSTLKQKLSAGGKRTLFPFYQIPSSNPAVAVLRKEIGLADENLGIVAINGKRNWRRDFKGGNPVTSSLDLETWLDDLRMGDLPKTKLSEGLLVEGVKAESTPKPKPAAGGAKLEDYKLEDFVTPEKFQELKEQMLKGMPEGMDLEIEEYDEPASSKKEKEETVIEHLEL
jgi:protein disulfide-isomerase A6